MHVPGCGVSVTAFFVGFILAGTITALVIQKKNKNRVNLFIDHEFAFGIGLNAALTLKKGQYLSDDAIATLKNEDAIEQAYQKSLHFLSFRARSEQEIKRYLQKKAVDDPIITVVIDRLHQQNYLDDTDFARQWVASRSRSKPKGKRALRYELRQKGLTETAIEHAIATVDEFDLAWRAAQKALYRWKSLDTTVRHRKITAFLARRGFSYEVISDTIAKVEAFLIAEEND